MSINRGTQSTFWVFLCRKDHPCWIGFLGVPLPVRPRWVGFLDASLPVSSCFPRPLVALLLVRSCLVGLWCVRLLTGRFVAILFLHSSWLSPGIVLMRPHDIPYAKGRKQCQEKKPRFKIGSQLKIYSTGTPPPQHCIYLEGQDMN